MDKEVGGGVLLMYVMNARWRADDKQLAIVGGFPRGELTVSCQHTGGSSACAGVLTGPVETDMRPNLRQLLARVPGTSGQLLKPDAHLHARHGSM